MFKFYKHSEYAIVPDTKKQKPGDIGIDLSLIELEKVEHGLYVYSTGLAVINETDDYYVQIVPRSSFVKTGFVMPNNVGIIDKGYTGPIKVCLRKVNPDCPDLELPGRYIQMIICKNEKGFSFEEINTLPKTERGSGGFGSTGLL